jgi:predicted transcriptional regulator of viral defense system
MKTLGQQSAKLVETLQDERRQIFTIDDAARILKSPRNVVSNMLGKAEKRGILTRLRRGVYILVPSEMGSETVYAGNPLIVADRLLGSRQHFLSHGTALAIHGMTLQPRTLVIISAVQPTFRHINSQGTEIKVVAVNLRDVFGIASHWIDDETKVDVSDLERTVVDCLRHPNLCGGYSEIDIGVWMVRDRIDTERLVEYALRLGVGAVIRRLGYLLDSCQIGTDADRNRLSAKLTPTYQLLDSSLPPDGPYAAKWRLRLNVDQEEIEAQRST